MSWPLTTIGQYFPARVLWGADVFNPDGGASGAAFYSASLDRCSTGVSMMAQRFFGTALGYYEASGALRLKDIGLGLVMSTNGTADMSEHRIRISGAKALSKDFSLSLSLGFSSVVTKGYGSSGVPEAGVGMMWRISDACEWVFQADRVNAFFSNKDPGYAMRSGLGFHFSKQCIGSVQVMANENSSSLFLLALDYLPAEHLAFRAGYCQEEFMASAAFLWSGMRFAVNSSWHVALGLSHGISVSWSKKAGS